MYMHRYIHVCPSTGIVPQSARGRQKACLSRRQSGSTLAMQWLKVRVAGAAGRSCRGLTPAETVRCRTFRRTFRTMVPRGETSISCETLKPGLFVAGAFPLSLSISGVGGGACKCKGS